MTPDQLQEKWVSNECGCTFIRKCHHAQMAQEIERLQIAFDGIVTLHDVNLRELEQAKSQQVHCAACGGVECHRLAEIVQLTGMESDQHLVEWVEQTKEQFALLKAGYKIEVSRSLDFEKQFKQAKERERQLQYDLSQPNPNVFVPNTTTDGTGNSEAFRELSSLYKVKDLESANARLSKTLAELRKFSHSSQCRYILTRAVKTCDCPKGIVDDYFKAEAALTVPPAQSVVTGRLSQSGTTANTDMAKVNNRLPDNEREAWLDGRARVKPEKEKP